MLGMESATAAPITRIHHPPVAGLMDRLGFSTRSVFLILSVSFSRIAAVVLLTSSWKAASESRLSPASRVSLSISSSRFRRREFMGLKIVQAVQIVQTVPGVQFAEPRSGSFSRRQASIVGTDARQTSSDLRNSDIGNSWDSFCCAPLASEGLVSAEAREFVFRWPALGNRLACEARAKTSRHAPAWLL